MFSLAQPEMKPLDAPFIARKGQAITSEQLLRFLQNLSLFKRNLPFNYGMAEELAEF